MDINNEKLIEIINKMKEEQTQESQNEVIHEVLKSQFMCPVILPDAPRGGGKININRNSKVQFSIIKTNDDKNFLIAFTSDDEVKKWIPQGSTQQSLIYSFADYAQVVLNNDGLEGFILDPRGVNLVFTKEMISQISGGITTKSDLKAGTEIQLSMPAAFPENLIEKACDIFRNIPDVSKAFMLSMKQDGKESYLLVLDANGNEETHLNRIVTAILPFVGNMPISVVPFATDLGRAVAEKFDPMYVSI